MQHKEMIFG